MRNLTKTLAVVSLLASARVFPLGIGEIKLHSALNQNLHAEIGLVLSPGENLDYIKVNLAPPEKFDEAGVPWTYFLSKIKLETVKSNGNAIIKLTSKEALKEPFLDFLIEVTGPKGSLYREFTVLLDPPSFHDQPVAPVYTQPHDYSYPPQPKYVQPQLSPRTGTSRTSAPSVDLSSGRYGPTRQNDTLWKVAERVSRQTGISIEQTMIGLYEANPRAFYKPNVNALLAGKTLSIPDRDVFLKLSRQQAADLFKQQNVDWQNRAVPPKAVAASAEQPEYTESQLKLVAPKQNEASDTEVVSSGVQPSDEKRTEETAVEKPSPSEKVDEAVTGAEDQAMAEKIAKLEQQLAEMQKLIALRNQELAALQGQLTIKESQKRLPAQVSGEEKIDKKPDVQASKPSKAITSPETQAKLDDTWGGLYYLLAGLGASLLLYFTWVYRRRHSLDNNEPLGEFVFSGGLQSSKKPSEIFQASNLEEDEVSKENLDNESLFGTDFAVSDFDVFDIDQGEIDPVSEADVYMAYGRYQQAEELIRLAINDQPERGDYQLKLLEIFFTSENKSAFENYAQELLSSGKDADTVFWEKVVEMGGEICPDSALFSKNIQKPIKYKPPLNKLEELPLVNAEGSDNLFDDVDFDLASFDQLFSKTDQDLSDVDSQISFDSKGLLLKPSDKESLFIEHDEPKPNNEPIDFNLMGFPISGLESPSTDKESPSSVRKIDAINQIPAFAVGEMEDSELSISHNRQDTSSFSLEKPLTLKDRIANTDLEDDFDFSTVLNQLSDRTNDSNVDVKSLNEIDELEIQLDLALAYVDMGDKNAAKEIAGQVLKNGNQEQQMVAKSILENL